LDVGRDDNTFRGREQKESRSRELRRALLTLLLRSGAALIGLSLRDAAVVASGTAIRLDLPWALTFDAAVVSGFRGGFAGAGCNTHPEERNCHKGGNQTVRHQHHRVWHRSAPRFAFNTTSLLAQPACLRLLGGSSSPLSSGRGKNRTNRCRARHLECDFRTAETEWNRADDRGKSRIFRTEGKRQRLTHGIAHVL
jgi:hypothetical protein